MGKQGRVGADDPSEPHPCPLGPGPEPLVLVAAPADQVGVYPPQGAAESRPIEVAVVVDPALDVRIEHPCQILQGLCRFVCGVPTDEPSAVLPSAPLD